MPNLYVGEKFFETWKRTQYHFQDDEAKRRFFEITNRPSGPVILYDLFWRAKRLVDDPEALDYRELKARSAYNPDMLRPHASAWEKGGHLGEYDAALLTKAFRMAREMWKLNEKVVPLELEDVPFKDDTNFGAPLFASKHPYAREVALKRAKAVLRGAAPEPFTAYSRGKDETQVRITQAEPKEMFLIGGSFFYPYMEEMKHIESPYAGGGARLEISSRVTELRWNSRWIASIDYSKYDASIPKRLIELAFNVMESNISFTRETRKRWNIYKKHFIHGGILMPDGYVYFGRAHGIPSGSILTSIIGSIINSIVLTYILLRNECNWSGFLVLGDDSLVGLNSPLKKRLIAETAAELGIKVSVDDTEVFLASEKPYFLGHYWSDGCPWRPVEDTIMRLVCPERPKAWMFADERSPEFIAGLADKLKDYVTDNLNFNELANKLLDSYLIPSQPWTWGMHNRKVWNYTNVRLDRSNTEVNGLERVLKKDYQRTASSSRILALY